MRCYSNFMLLPMVLVRLRLCYVNVWPWNVLSLSDELWWFHMCLSLTFVSLCVTYATIQIFVLVILIYSSHAHNQGELKANCNYFVSFLLSWLSLLRLLITFMILHVWLSSTNKKGEIESAIMPLYYVFDVNDNLHVGD